MFAEQGSSASQMTAVKVMDVIARLPACARQAADAVSAYTPVKMEDAPTLLKIPKSECPDIWIRLPRHKDIQDLLSGGKTPYERRFGMPFNGQVIPFGALVEYHPVCAKDPSRLHRFGPKIMLATLLGHALHANLERRRINRGH